MSLGHGDNGMFLGHVPLRIARIVVRPVPGGGHLRCAGGGQEPREDFAFLGAPGAPVLGADARAQIPESALPVILLPPAACRRCQQGRQPRFRRSRFVRVSRVLDAFPHRTCIGFVLA